VAYLDAGTGSLIIFLIGAVPLGLFIGGWVMNILGAIGASKRGRDGRSRMIVHIVAAVIYPIGCVLGWVWFFVWRKTDNSSVGVL
jgi:hypothetical protein